LNDDDGGGEPYAGRVGVGGIENDDVRDPVIAGSTDVGDVGQPVATLIREWAQERDQLAGDPSMTEAGRGGHDDVHPLPHLVPTVEPALATRGQPRLDHFRRLLEQDG